MKRILVIDDEQQIRTLVAHILESEGYRVDQASDGQKGLYQMQREPVDVIITDILMPAKDGLETIREIRRDFPAAKIIAISGGSQRWGEMEFLPIAQKFGADRILPKPFHHEQLLNNVRDLIRELENAEVTGTVPG